MIGPSDRFMVTGPSKSDLNAAQKPRSTSRLGFWRSLVFTLTVALGIRHFIVEARYIPSGSMLPGLQLQDRLLVEKLTYRVRAPRRGEIVVFRAPQAFDPALKQDYAANPLRCFVVNLPFIGGLPGLQEPSCEAFIKRVVAIPGDKVVVDPNGRLNINGKAVGEPYVQRFCASEEGKGCQPLRAVVPPKSVFVLGDNRANSWDGRFWPGTHFLPDDQIIGRALFRFWPLSSAGSLVSPDPTTQVRAIPSPAPAP